MSDLLRVTVLIENSVHRMGLAAEHGLSFHLTFRGQSVLFDTGQTDLATLNAQQLGISMHDVGAVVLSHGHYDHTGGLPAVLSAAPQAKVFAHPAAFAPKYSRHPGTPARFIGMSAASAHALSCYPVGVTSTRGWTRVVDGIYATGEIPRITDYEDTGGPFHLDADARRPDLIVDDQALVVDLGESVVVLLGCAHSGVVNTLDHVARHTGNKPVRGVMGGMHLGSAGAGRMAGTIERVRQAGPEVLMPLHCTGWPALAQLWQAFPNSFRMGGVGTVIEL